MSSETPVLDQCLRAMSTRGPARKVLVMMVPGLVLVCALAALVAGWKAGVALAAFALPMVLLIVAAVQLTHVAPMVRRLRAAATRKDDVVWIYDRVSRGRRTGTHDYVAIGLSDGTLVELQTTYVDDAQRAALLAELRARSPQATFGFSPEALQTFRANPHALRRSAGATDKSPAHPGNG